MTNLPEQARNRIITEYQEGSEQYFIGLMEDIFTMMNHARENGIEMPETLRTDIAELLDPDD